MLLILYLCLRTLEKNFSFENTNYNEKNKYNLLGKNRKFCRDTKLFLKQPFIHSGKYKKDINAKIQDFLRIHIYLPDLRKEVFNFESQNSLINMLFNYDINSRNVIVIKKFKLKY